MAAPLTVRVVAGVLIEQDRKFLLVQEGQAKARGKWNWPAGHVDIGETIEQAAVREAKEEVGLDVELGRELLVLHPDAAHSVFHAFAATITGGELNWPPNEILDARWFTSNEIRGLNEHLRLPEFIIGAIDNYLRPTS